MSLKRFKFYTAVLLGFTFLSTGSANAQEPIVLTFAAGSPSSSNVCTGQLKKWADGVEASSKGQITVKIVCDGILADNREIVDRIEQGVVDAGWVIPALFGAQFSTLAITGLPGVFDDAEDAGGALFRAHEEGLLDGQLDNYKVLWIQGIGNNSIFSTNPIKSVTKLDGLKLAVEARGRAVMISAMGGTPVALNIPEYYPSLQRGLVDGVMTSVAAIQAFKMDEVLRHTIIGPFGGGTTIALMNKEVYEGLPADLQRAIDENSGYEMSRWTSAFLRDIEVNYFKDVMMAHSGASKVTLTDEQKAAWNTGFQATIDNWLGDSEVADTLLKRFQELVVEESAK
ncbi:MAG: TRAP transporter substrate-binding protein DctP [Alphaproteobacteria bacterium]|nr:TRAP transporter substrate-binding protein DctP [Alphaproteobacteria bacterium]